MKNSIINFETEELDDFIVRDYFSKDIAVYNILDELTDYIETYSVQNGDKLERISYELYGNTDYWDLLLQLNDRNPLFQMPYKFDYIADNVADKINTYQNVIYSHAPVSQERRIVLYNDMLSIAEEANESYRDLYVIKPSLISEAIAILKTKGYL